MNPKLTVLPLLLAHSLAAAAADGKASAYQGSASQEQLRLATQELESELKEIAAEYGQYSAASKEVGKLNEGIAVLGELTGKEMPAVVTTLLTASRQDGGQIAEGLRTANGQQKEIQTKLRLVADQLSKQAAAGAMRARLEELALRQAANLRATRKLEETESSAGESITARTEQAALEKEIAMAAQSLRELAAAPEAATDPGLPAASQIAEKAGLEELAKQAAAEMAAGKPIDSASKQAQIMEALKAMRASLDASRSPEERAWEMAASLAELAAKQEAAAETTSHSDKDQELLEARQKQEDITDRLGMLQTGLEQLDPAAAEQADQAAQDSEQSASELGDKSLPHDAPRLSATVQDQRALATRLAEMGRKMQEKAVSTQGGSMSSFQPSEQDLAIQEAMRLLIEARKLAEAAREISERSTAFQEPLDQAAANINKALEKATQAGPMVSTAVQKDLAEAQDRGVQARKERAEHHLYRMREGVDRAVSALENVINQLALASTGDPSQGGGGEGDGQGGNGQGGPGKGGPMVSAVSEAGNAQRDALRLMEEEKVAPGYEEMVRQYIKNLSGQ